MVAVSRCIVCGHSEPFALVFKPADYGCAMVRCPNCGLVFQEPQPSDEMLERSYYQDPEFSRLLLGSLREFTLQRAREKLVLLRDADAVHPGMRVLDVGCSSGAWLEVAGAAGLTATGVEIGETTARDARRRGLDVRTGTLERCFGERASERFELITFWDVLEHLRDPRRELEVAARLLAPGGLIAATFPNVAGWYPRVTYRLLARWTGAWDYPELPVHLYDFAPATARLLLERAGYRLQHIRTLPVPFSFYRGTSLTRARLGGGARAVILRLAFEALKLAVYPAAAAFDRQNAVFLIARRV